MEYHTQIWYISNTNLILSQKLISKLTSKLIIVSFIYWYDNETNNNVKTKLV